MMNEDNLMGVEPEEEYSESHKVHYGDELINEDGVDPFLDPDRDPDDLDPEDPDHDDSIYFASLGRDSGFDGEGGGGIDRYKHVKTNQPAWSNSLTPLGNPSEFGSTKTSKSTQFPRTSLLLSTIKHSSSSSTSAIENDAVTAEVTGPVSPTSNKSSEIATSTDRSKVTNLTAIAPSKTGMINAR